MRYQLTNAQYQIPPTAEAPVDTKMKADVSTLWVFIMFNLVFRDLHDFYLPGHLELMSEGVGPGILLAGSLMMEVPISMILFSQLLPANACRELNRVIGPLLIVSVLGYGVQDWDDYFFIAIAILALFGILWKVWRWEPQVRQ